MSALNRLKRIANADATPDAAPLVSWRNRLPRAAPVGTKPQPWQVETIPHHPTVNRSRVSVGKSEDLERILTLPRRPPVDLEGDTSALVARVTAKYARANANCRCAEFGRQCIRTLNPAQCWALEEIREFDGLLGPLQVGSGKTVLNLLSPLAIRNCKLAVLLIPPNLKDQLVREYELLSQHFQVPSLVVEEKGKIVPGKPVLHVLPYSKFSRPESTDILRHLAPDLIVADEGHRMKSLGAASTSRFVRYFAERPETRLCIWSGTLISKSIKDVAHLSAFALKNSSPFPLEPQTVQEWSLAIDPSDWPAPIGELAKLCNPGEHIQKAFHRRIVDTPGVVATKAGALGASLYIDEKKAPPVPETLDVLLKALRNDKVRPDGEELVDILEVARCARELAVGFFYRFRYPKGHVHSEGCECRDDSKELCTPCKDLIGKWFGIRKAWHRELREMLRNPVEHMDSPLLCANAAIRHYAGYKGDLPTWESATWPAWKAIREKVDPVSTAQWVDDYLCRDAANWATKNRGIVWYANDAVGRKIGELSGLPVHGGGPDAERKILAEKGDRSIIVSIKAHGEGRDGLQRLFNEQLIVEPPASGKIMEQLLGRLHRVGQKEDEIRTLVYRHVEELRDAFDTSLRLSAYLQEISGNRQKLLSANVSFKVGKR